MKRKIFIVAFFSLLCFIVKAQTPCFNVESTIGCTPFTVKVKNCCTSYSQRFYIYEGTRFISDSVYTYTKPGVYTITQLVYKDSTHRNDPTPGNYFRLVKKNLITVVDAVPPKFKLTPCVNNLLRVEIEDTISQKYTHYYINYGDGKLDTIFKYGFKEHVFLDSLPKNINIRGAIMPINCGADTAFSYDALFVNMSKPKIEYLKTITSSSNAGIIEMKLFLSKHLTYQLNLNGKPYDTLTYFSGFNQYQFKNLNTLDSVYDIQIKVLNICDGTSLDSEVFKIVPINLSVLENQNVIDEFTYYNSSAVIGYDLYRNESVLVSKNQPDFTKYIDNNVKCGSQYCYSIKTNLVSGVYLLTDTICGTAISTTSPPAPINVNSLILNNYVQLFADKASNHTVNKYSIFTKDINGNFNPYSEIKKFPFIDSKVYNNVTCFKISVTDSCGNVSDLSTETCPVLLNSSNVSSASINLDWNNYVGWNGNGIKQFTLEWVNELEIPYKNIDLGILNTFNDNTEDTVSSLIRYRIKAQGLNDDFVSYSNIVERKQAVKIFLPTGFTPNNDGENDVYLARGRFVASFKMYVYNRLGQVVFFSDDFNKGWKGENVVSGDYVVEVEASDSIGNTIKKKSIITLIK